MFIPLPTVITKADHVGTYTRLVLVLLFFVAVFIITTASFEELETFAASLGGRSINRRGAEMGGSRSQRQDSWPL